MDKVIDSVLLKALDIYKESNEIPSNYSLANYLNVSQGTISRWYSGKSQTIKFSAWKDLEPILRPYLEQAIDEQQFTQELEPFTYQLNIAAYEDSKKLKLKKMVSDFEKGLNELMSEVQEEPQPVIDFPYLSQEVSAGNGLIPSEEKYGERPDMDILTVSGESMQPKFMNGEKIIVHTFQERVQFGEHHLPMDIVKSLIPEDTVIIYDRNNTGLAMKRVKYQQGKDTWYFKLTADNTEWAKETKFNRIIKKTDDFVIYGKVVGKVK